MITATFARYANGEHQSHEIALRQHVTVTGREDHFEMAYHDAKMIMLGMRTADLDANARWRIVSIDMGQ